jgi:thiamine pyrophosphate-dependent acetolactate synthase large subunit-like protein
VSGIRFSHRRADLDGTKPGRYLGCSRYDMVAQGLGCHGEYVERPEDIRPALGRAQNKVDAGIVARVSVETDYRTRTTTTGRFSNYMAWIAAGGRRGRAAIASRWGSLGDKI